MAFSFQKYQMLKRKIDIPKKRTISNGLNKDEQGEEYIYYNDCNKCWMKYLCCFIIIFLLLWILYCLYTGCHHCQNSTYVNNNAYTALPHDDLKTRLTSNNKDLVMTSKEKNIQLTQVEKSKNEIDVNKIIKEDNLITKKVLYIHSSFNPHILPKNLNPETTTLNAGKLTY
jgi:hypothetical protein